MLSPDPILLFCTYCTNTSPLFCTMSATPVLWRLAARLIVDFVGFVDFLDGGNDEHSTDLRPATQSQRRLTPRSHFTNILSSIPRNPQTSPPHVRGTVTTAIWVLSLANTLRQYYGTMTDTEIPSIGIHRITHRPPSPSIAIHLILRLTPCLPVRAHARAVHFPVLWF